jgi:hypothetical protein
MRAIRARTAAKRYGWALGLAFVLAWLPCPAAALVVDSGDGLGNTTPPPDDPGWRNVARRLAGPSIVYLGDGWVLTAAHVGAGIVEIEGERYDPIAASVQSIPNDDGTHSDLVVFRIDGDPDLPRLGLSGSSPQLAEDVVLIGFGAARGLPISLGRPPAPLRDGYHWLADDTKRWGTNVIADRARAVTSGRTRTMSIPTVFNRIDDPGGTNHEAQAALGDSGGALFVREDRFDPESDWVLAGIICSVSNPEVQPERTTFYGDITFSADLAYYREAIFRIVRPICLAKSVRAADPESSCGPNAAGRAPQTDRLSRSMLLTALAVVLGLALGAVLRTQD